MKVRVAVVVVVVLALFVLAVPASASVRDHVSAKPAKRHPYGWMKLAPVDQAELEASRLAKPGAERLVVPVAPDQPSSTVRRGASLRAIRLNTCWDGFACRPFGSDGGALMLVKERPPRPPVDGGQA